MTYMNLSAGRLRRPCSSINPIDDLLVVVDDVALPCGTIRLRASGQRAGTTAWPISSGRRVLCGRGGKSRWITPGSASGSIRRAGAAESVCAGGVLQHAVAAAGCGLKKAAEAIATWATDGIAKAMNRYNPRTVQLGTTKQDQVAETCRSESHGSARRAARCKAEDSGVPMATHTGQYEALFLLNASYATATGGGPREVEHVLHRANAEILHLRSG